MATVKSDLMTNLGNKVQSGVGYVGKTIHAHAHYVAAGALDINTVITLMPIHVDAVITSVKLSCTDLGTAGDFNVGFYKVDGTTAIDLDAIGTAVDVNAAALSKSEIRFETKALTTMGQKAWELAGLSAKPDYSEMLLAIEVAEATTASGTILVEVEYKL